MTEKLEQAIHELELGNKQAAVSLLAQVLKEDPENEDAWIWMSEAVDDSLKKVECLEKVLEINPFNQDALRGLEHLRGETSFMRSDPFPFKPDDGAPEEQPVLTSEPFPEGQIYDDGAAPVWKFGDSDESNEQPEPSNLPEWELEPKTSHYSSKAAPALEEPLDEIEPPSSLPELSPESAEEDALNIRDLISDDGAAVPDIPVVRRERKPALLTPQQFKILAIMAGVVLLLVLGGGGWIVYTYFFR
jgi:tetratricopeptide (TPR) repeat protein